MRLAMRGFTVYGLSGLLVFGWLLGTVIFTVVFGGFGAGGPREDDFCGLRYSCFWLSSLRFVL